MEEAGFQKREKTQLFKKNQNDCPDSDINNKCTHTVIMKDMCCICGKNLRPEGGFSGERTEPTEANVSMIHHVPELVVSKEIADELGARDHQNIVRQRKLILLLDLDQTLVHTSNRLPRPEEISASDLIGYRLGGCAFYTKVRPYARKLIEHLNILYEMHIVTFGQRLYAHKIAEILDPNKTYFDYRILSRDELLSSMHKTGNLKALFPCSEQLILMLDDRPDVWMHSEALIRVKPYRFFTEVGDINAPPQEFIDSPTRTAIPNDPANVESEIKNSSKSDQSDSSTKEEKEGEDETTKNDELMKESSKEKDETIEKGKREEDAANITKKIAPVVDDDNALEHIERVLTEIHSLFYQRYDRDKKIPDVKQITKWARAQVLAGERIVFSGLIPIGVDVRACEIYRMCTQFGAKIDDQIDGKKTTVLVAARAATEKFRLARRLGIPVVNTRWLDACFERWRRVDKRDFMFREEDDEQQLTDVGKTTNRRNQHSAKRKSSEENEADSELADEAGAVKRHRISSVSLCLDEKDDHFAQINTLSMKTMHEMEDEVDSALSEADEDDDDKKENGSSSPSTDYSDENEPTDELPSTSSETRHNKPWEEGLNGSERYEDEDAESDREEYDYSTRGAQYEDEYDSKEVTDYGDEDNTRDVELDGEEDELYDEMADDLEGQLMGEITVKEEKKSGIGKDDDQSVT